MKRLGPLLLPPSLDGMLVYHRVPSMKRLRVLPLLPWDVSPSQGTQHEATRSITSPPLDRMLVNRRITAAFCYFSLTVHWYNLFAWVERKETTRCMQKPGLKPPTLASDLTEKSDADHDSNTPPSAISTEDYRCHFISILLLFRATCTQFMRRQ